jgi:hypothetical protein
VARGASGGGGGGGGVALWRGGTSRNVAAEHTICKQ